MASTAEDLLEAGREALERGEWATARSLLSDAVDQEPLPEALYHLARACEWAGDYAAALDGYERAYRGLRETGRTRLAALIAGRELSFLHAAVYGNAAVAGGWMARARSLIDEAGDCVERGWVELAEALMVDDPGTKDGHVRAATDIARRFGDDDLRFCALGYEGTVLVLRGRVEEGMRRIDESATAATNGEVKDYLAVGEIYCKMLLCCELTLDVRRAQQWMRVAESFGRRENALWVSAICRTHYGGILTVAGRWDEAERELSVAAGLYDAGFRALRGSALVRLADLRVRQGRLEEAARLLDGMESEPFAVRPLARLHLARGESALASTCLRRFLAAEGEQAHLAPEWALLVEAELAGDRPHEAGQAYARLAAVAHGAEAPHVAGFRSYAAGLLAAARQDPSAVADFEAALAAFTTGGLPLEAGRARLAIARLLVSEEPEVAKAEARAALTSFDRLRARPDADAAAALLRHWGETGRAAPRLDGLLTKREREVLDLVGAGLSNEQIAQRLFISKRTVEHHVGNILAKLGFTRRAEAVGYALRQGSQDPVTHP